MSHGRKVFSNGTLPLGRLANAELRLAKQRAHAAFDALWKDGSMERSEAYSALAKALGLAFDDCHIGYFDLDTCARVVELSQTIRQNHS
jgi:2-hydroxychromene-2-carboxylate isomerase